MRTRRRRRRRAAAGRARPPPTAATACALVVALAARPRSSSVGIAIYQRVGLGAHGEPRTRSSRKTSSMRWFSGRTSATKRWMPARARGGGKVGEHRRRDALAPQRVGRRRTRPRRCRRRRGCTSVGQDRRGRRPRSPRPRSDRVVDIARGLGSQRQVGACREEAERPRLRRQRLEDRAQRGLILGTDRPQADRRPAAQRDVDLTVGRIVRGRHRRVCCRHVDGPSANRRADGPPVHRKSAAQVRGGLLMQGVEHRRCGGYRRGRP